MSDWPLLAERASNITGTPCYVLSEQSVLDSLKRLRALESSVPLRHWMSFKTQPVARQMRMALELGLGVDVVSEHELHGALAVGFQADRILVNGVGKQGWLKRCRTRNLLIHFDSLAEVRELAPLARMLNWKVGLRCAIPAEGWDQFGMSPEELLAAARALGQSGVAIRGLHFHLHTSSHRVVEYRRALSHEVSAAQAARIEPEYLDVGGGLPITGEALLDGTVAAESFDLGEFRDFLASITLAISSVKEVWLENGRFLTGASGVLVVTVLDRKDRGEESFLICDGGRVNHARMAAIEKHDILVSPSRAGSLVKTHVCGPTCGAIDRLGSWMLPRAIEPGDRIIWLNAGAYHIPLETRFSTGLAPVVWFNQNEESEIIRPRETPEKWWGMWNALDESPQAAGVGL